MPSEMVKRIAETAKAQAACLNDWEAEGVSRAAIEAMREPTEAMWLETQVYRRYDSDPLEEWNAMIDAALETGK